MIHFYESGRDELYHLPTDRAEQEEKSDSNPQMAGELRKKLQASLKATGARLPMINPDWQIASGTGWEAWMARTRSSPTALRP